MTSCFFHITGQQKNEKQIKKSVGNTGASEKMQKTEFFPVRKNNRGPISPISSLKLLRISKSIS